QVLSPFDPALGHVRHRRHAVGRAEQPEEVILRHARDGRHLVETQRLRERTVCMILRPAQVHEHVARRSQLVRHHVEHSRPPTATNETTRMEPISAADEIEAIRRLKARYFRTMDSKDWAAMRQVFTDDVEIDTTASGGSVISGADEFIAFLRDTLADVVTVH